MISGETCTASGVGVPLLGKFELQSSLRYPPRIGARKLLLRLDQLTEGGWGAQAGKRSGQRGGRPTQLLKLQSREDETSRNLGKTEVSSSVFRVWSAHNR